MKYLQEALAASAHQSDGAVEGADRPRQLRGWLTIRELAEYLRFTVTAKDPEDAAREWLRRERITTVRRGRIILVDAFDVDHALRRR